MEDYEVKSMNEESSILVTIRKMIGGDTASTEFDMDLIIAINSAISTLYQLGIEKLRGGEGFSITGETETWDDLLGEYMHVDLIKGYVYLKTRLLFDPPQNSFLVNSIQDQIKEMEWRITVAIETDNSAE